MSGPVPAFRPEFPEDFVEGAHQIVRRRTAQFQQRQRAKLVLLLHENPLVSNVAAGEHVEMHPDSVRDWRRRWAKGDFSLQDKSGRGRKPAFFPG